LRESEKFRTFLQLFAAQVAARPDAVAVESGPERLSYAQLNAQANRLAHHLIQHGVTADTRVAISLPRGPQLITALLAVLKAGGAYLPIDPDYPTEPLEHFEALVRETFAHPTSF